MVESKELHEKVDKILQRVESMDNFMPWLIRPQAKEILGLMLEYFKKQIAAAKVYLEVDGEKGVTAMGQCLKMKQPNVSREIKKLNDMGLIEPKTIGSSVVYKKTKIDRIIGLTRALEKLIEEVKNGKQTGNRNKGSI